MALYNLRKKQYFINSDEPDEYYPVFQIVIEHVSNKFIYYNAYGVGPPPGSMNQNLLAIYEKRKVFMDEGGLYIYLQRYKKQKFYLEIGALLLNDV